MFSTVLSMLLDGDNDDDGDDDGNDDDNAADDDDAADDDGDGDGSSNSSDTLPRSADSEVSLDVLDQTLNPYAQAAAARKVPIGPLPPRGRCEAFSVFWGLGQPWAPT